jgi:hypothetical protein
MTIDRRSFLAGAAALAIPAQARSAETERGRSVTEFGVEPNTDKMHGQLFQKAVDEISAAGQPVYVPAGRYRVGDVKLPAKCIINGDPGQTILLPKLVGGEVFLAAPNQSLQISGLVFDGRAGNDVRLDLVTAIFRIYGGVAVLRECEFRNTTGEAIYADDVSAIFTMNHSHHCNHGALRIWTARSLLIRQCRFEDNGSTSTTPTEVIFAYGQDVQIADNFISRCSAGIRVKGNGEIKDNIISGPGAWGLKLGGGADDAQGLSVAGNSITACDIGIGLAPGAEWLSITRNTIAGATQGAIRAFDNATPTGPDLAFERPGTYPNLGLAGNVVRPSGNSP